MECLAAELSQEFGVEFLPTRSDPSTHRRRVFQTTRWVFRGSLTGVPDWHSRLEASIRRVADIVDPDLPSDAFIGAPSELPLEMSHRRGDWGADGDPSGGPDEDIEVMFLGEQVTFRDRLGGDVLVTVDPDETSVSAIASVGPH
ncbi:hypothetical protein [Propionicimonas sp.]|uniref:hypothetical protein n=1 Tax=Propionicimonas sp. TaxID=1955623 RepID=UPI003D0E37B3